jgi:Ca-activated chloride channel family protein
MNAKTQIRWNITLDRELVGVDGGKRHVLVDVAAPLVERASSERPSLNLALVIDASGSMSGEPLAAAKRAAAGIVKVLRPNDCLTVVSFSSDVITHVDALAMDGHAKDRAAYEIDRLETRGMTNLSAGWLRGCECLARRMDVLPPGTQNRVIVISDGFANEGMTSPDELGRHARELRDRGIFTSAIGIGDGYSPTQLQALVEHGNGRMHDAADGHDLVEVVLGELGEILNTAAEDIHLEVGHPYGMPVQVLGPYPSKPVIGRAEDFAVGSLVAGASRQFVLQFSVPRGEIGTGFPFWIKATWKVPGQDAVTQAVESNQEVKVASDSDVRYCAMDEKVGTKVAELWKAALINRATTLNGEGRVEAGRCLIEEALPEFQEYCSRIPDGKRLVVDLRDYGRAIRDQMDPREYRACFMASRKIMACEPELRNDYEDQLQLLMKKKLGS